VAPRSTGSHFVHDNCLKWRVIHKQKPVSFISKSLQFLSLCLKLYLTYTCKFIKFVAINRKLWKHFIACSGN
jgi:hypothetical protein